MSSDNEQMPTGDGLNPVSRGFRVLRGIWAWLQQWLYWDERPTAEAFREACRVRDQALRELEELRVMLAASRAESEAAKAEMRTLALVVERDRARVEAELAAFNSDRERHLRNTRSARMPTDEI